MTLRLRPEAMADIADAARWYEKRQTGLGEAFVAEIDSVLQRIESGPERYQVYHRGLRRALARRFA